MNDKAVDPAVLRAELLAAEFATLIGKNKLETYFLIAICQCGGCSLRLDMSKTPRSQSLVRRLGKKFAHKNNLGISTELNMCPSCKQSRTDPVVRHVKEYTAEGVARDEVVVYHSILSA